jgi:hypothetical protein
MSALTVLDLVNTAPLGAPVPEGLLVFPISAAVAWVIVGGFLVVACALLTLATARGPVWASGRHYPRPARRFRPQRRQPQPS